MRSGNQPRGQGMTEYILIVALVAIATIGVVTAFGDQLRALFGMSADALAGETSVQSRERSYGPEKRDLTNFGESNAYGGDKLPGG